MLLKEFREYIAARLGGDTRNDFYSLGNKLEGDDSELWTHSYVAHGAHVEIRRRRTTVSSESASARDL